MKTKRCLWCGEEFAQRPGQADKYFHPQKFCCTAHQISAKQKRYMASEKGHATARRAQERYRATEKGRTWRRCYESSEKRRVYLRAYAISDTGHANVKRNKQRYRASEKGRTTEQAYVRSERRRASQHRYDTSEKGRLSARRHAYPKARYQMIHVKKLSCQQCGEIDITNLQLDHILAVGLGGTDMDENLQVLCKSCHKAKTRDDRRKMRNCPLVPVLTMSS